MTLYSIVQKYVYTSFLFKDLNVANIATIAKWHFYFFFIQRKKWRPRLDVLWTIDFKLIGLLTFHGIKVEINRIILDQLKGYEMHFQMLPLIWTRKSD